MYTISQLLGPGTEAAARLEFPDFSNLVASQESLICQIPSEAGICPGPCSGCFVITVSARQEPTAWCSVLLLPACSQGFLLECLCWLLLFISALFAPLLTVMRISCLPADLSGFCFPSAILQKQIINSLEQKAAKI